MKPEDYPTAHQLAKKLLEGPDHIVVLPRPVFDMPGQWMVLPVDIRPDKIENRDVIVLIVKEEKMVTCPRCDGNREEPGAPVEADGAIALCILCEGKHRVTAEAAAEYKEEQK